MIPDEDDAPLIPESWQSDYKEWCREMDDADINRLLDEAEGRNE